MKKSTNARFHNNKRRDGRERRGTGVGGGGRGEGGRPWLHQGGTIGNVISITVAHETAVEASWLPLTAGRLKLDGTRGHADSCSSWAKDSLPRKKGKIVVALGTRRVGGAERERSPPDSQVRVWSQLQALVYDILPSTTAVFSYAIGSRKLSANEQFFCWCSNSSEFVTNNSNSIRHLFYNWPCCQKRFWFYLSWRKPRGNIKQMSDRIWVVCNKPTTVWAPTKNCSLADSFLDPMAYLNTAVVWRKDVVNQCLEFGSECECGHYCKAKDSFRRGKSLVARRVGGAVLAPRKAS